MTESIVNGVVDTPEKVGTVLVSKGWFMPKQKYELIISGATAGTLYRVSQIINSMKMDTKLKDKDKQFFLLECNTKQIVEVIALAVHNKKGDPPKWLYNALLNQFSIEQLYEIFRVVYRRLDVSTFFGIMGSVRNLSLIDTQETEAHGQQSETSQSISG